MPDVVIVGGGIIGAACANELSRLGASVTLLERAELAAGASGRNQGLFLIPRDPALEPMARTGLATYLEVASDAPIPVLFDNEPQGWLALATAAHEVEAVREEARAAEAVGVSIERLDPTALLDLEPDLTPEVVEGWLLDDGRRLDPTALTLTFADLARRRGAVIRHHIAARRLLPKGDAVRGVLTDDGEIGCDAVVLAAGPWSAGLLRPLGIAVPVFGARGWLVSFAPERQLISHVLEGAARTIWRRTAEPVLGRELAEGVPATDVGPILQQGPDGSLVAGASRETAVSNEPEDPTIPSRIAAEAVRLVPALADTSVLGTWWGVRPMTPDERPLVGEVLPGLVIATGHGSEGVILGAGTAALVASIVLGEPPPFDPSPFAPLRFS